MAGEKPFNISEQGRKLIEDVQKAADPTKVSELPPADPMEDVGPLPSTLNRLHESGEGTYVGIADAPETQQAVARMLKGIINVSDIVEGVDTEGKPHFYSRVMPLEKIEKPTSANERNADSFILAHVFGATDFTNGNNTQFDGEHIAYFDFGLAADYMFSGVHTQQDVASALLMNPGSKGQLELTLKKLDALTERFSDEPGKELMDSILEATGKKISELFDTSEMPLETEYDAPDAFRTMFLKRIEMISSLVKSRIALG